MHSFSVGRFAVHHVEEWQGPFAAPSELFAGFDPGRFAAFRDELPAATYQRDDDRNQHAVLPCSRRAVAAASVKSSYDRDVYPPAPRLFR